MFSKITHQNGDIYVIRSFLAEKLVQALTERNVCCEFEGNQSKIEIARAQINMLKKHVERRL